MIPGLDVVIFDDNLFSSSDRGFVVLVPKEDDEISEEVLDPRTFGNDDAAVAVRAGG
jgi:hypothetical protein